MNFFKKLNTQYQVAVLTIVTCLLGFAISSFLLAKGRLDIPLGFLLGLVVIGGLNLLAGLASDMDEKKGKSTFSLIMLSVRLTVIVGVMVTTALMYYRWNLPIFNIFVFVGVYTASTLFTVTAHIAKKN